LIVLNFDIDSLVLGPSHFWVVDENPNMEPNCDPYWFMFALVGTFVPKIHILRVR